MISFRLRANWQNYRGYVPRYEQTTKNGWFDIHSVFATHVETCCLLVREQIKDDDLISIKVDLEGISLEQGKYVPEEKPTYGNVKKWIKEKYGFNVTNLYLGETKDKLT